MILLIGCLAILIHGIRTNSIEPLHIVMKILTAIIVLGVIITLYFNESSPQFHNSMIQIKADIVIAIIMLMIAVYYRKKIKKVINNTEANN